jgi:4-amino-4-deoxy-L-arabinose transferase-like glycosyltransferase
MWSLVSMLSVIAWLRGSLTAIVSTLAYLTYTPLLLWAGAQYEDIPLACYLVLGCAMVVAAEKFPEGGRRFWFFAWFFAGSAAWCKNEGIAFLLLVVLWWMCWEGDGPSG